MRDLLIDPIALLFLVTLLLWLMTWTSAFKRWRAALLRLFASILLIGMLLCASPAIVNRLLVQAENLVESPGYCEDESAPLVVLSGGVASSVRSADDLGKIYEATFIRMVEAIALIQRAEAEFPIYLLGGSQRRGIAEADVMHSFFVMAGVDENSLVLERVSSNTAASAVALAEIFSAGSVAGAANDSSANRIRLLTSALHMKRSKVVFEANGFDVCPIAVDRRAIVGVPWHAMLPQSSALRKFDLLLHESVGLLFYRLKGYL